MKNFNYFYTTELALPTSQWQLYYDFSETGVTIPSQTPANPQCSGTLSTLGSFNSISGSGLFSGQYLTINNATELASDNFTIFMVYEKPISGNAILFSSLTSGDFVSGFIVGINDANRLYFEAYDQTGPNVYTSSNIYGEKNAIAIVKSNNLLSFNYYNFNYQSIESELFTISSTAFYNFSQAYLGAPTNAPSYINQNNFTGYFDQFIYIDNALTVKTVQTLFSGFYASGLPNTIQTIVVTDISITGAQMIVAPIGTGTTGFNTFFSGNAFDNCGNAIPIYSYNNLTGIISGNTFFPLTGLISFTVTGIIDNGFFIDTGYCNSFGMNGISLLNNSGQNSIEFYYYQQEGTVGNNLIGQYSLDSTFKLNDFYNNSLINVYDDGLSYYPDGFYISGNGYISSLYLSGDYLVSGQSIISTGRFISTDTLIYDSISGNKEKFNVLTTGGASFVSSNISVNRIIFLNGEKLFSGINYNFSGSYLNLINNSQTGILTNLPITSGFFELSGNFSNTLSPKFGKDSSMVWKNGLRQTLNEDYIEISSIDLLNGSGIFDFFTGILYNNDNRFMEIW